MNADKAREFFSSYFEGTLDAGLRQAFELRLQTDAETQAEYRAFERSMAQLNTLKDAEIEIPFDLNERISARLDRHIFEAKRAKGSPWMSFWKPLAIGGLAAAAIVGTVFTMNNRAKVSGAGITGGGTTAPKIESPAPAPKGFSFQIEPAQLDRQVTVTDALSGEARGGMAVKAGEDFSFELLNPGAKTEFIKVEISGDKMVRYVAVPSKSADGAAFAAKDATLRGAALRLAQQYNRPIVLMAKDPLQALPLTSTVATDPANGVREVFGSEYAVEVRNDNFIRVQEH